MNHVIQTGTGTSKVTQDVLLVKVRESNNHNKGEANSFLFTYTHTYIYTHIIHRSAQFLLAKCTLYK